MDKLHFSLLKETQQTVVYKEDNDVDPVIGTLYVRKYALAAHYRATGAFPSQIDVTVDIPTN